MEKNAPQKADKTAMLVSKMDILVQITVYAMGFCAALGISAYFIPLSETYTPTVKKVTGLCFNFTALMGFGMVIMMAHIGGYAYFPEEIKPIYRKAHKRTLTAIVLAVLFLLLRWTGLWAENKWLFKMASYGLMTLYLIFAILAGSSFAAILLRKETSKLSD